MTIIKKTLIAALAAVTMSTAGLAFTATQVEAGHYYGHRQNYQPKHHQPRHCSWKRIKHWDGYQWIWYRKWVCS